MTIDSRDLPRKFVQMLVNMANSNDARVDGTTKPVMELVAANDVVFGVWRDASERGGAGLLVVKGENRLRDIIAGGASQVCRITAISCGAYEQAEALRLHINTDPVH